MSSEHCIYRSKCITFWQKETYDLRIVIKNNCFMYKKLCSPIRNYISYFIIKEGMNLFTLQYFIEYNISK